MMHFATTRKFALAALVLIISSLSLAQFQDPEFVAELRKEYKDINPDLFRDAHRVVPKGFMNNYSAYGGGVKEGKASSKFVEIPRFKKVIEVETHDKFYNDWDVEIGCPTSEPVMQDDCIYLTFWIRCLASRDESNQGFARVYLQKNSPNYDKSVYVSVIAGSDWAQYRVPFHTKHSNYNGGEAAVAFALGYSYQTIQIADVQVINMGATVRKEELPGTRFTYEGRDPDAAWRKKASENIEKYRKGDLTVVVKDKDGKVVPNAKVAVDMTNHEFGFGNIVSRVAFSNPGPNGQKYREVVKENFNQVTFENALKHDLWEQYKLENSTAKIFETLDSLDAYNIKLRGHALVWGSTNYTKVAIPYLDRKDEFRKMLIDHIDEVATAVKGRVIDWDVVNEPFVNHQFVDILGKEEHLEWFKAARKAEPNADLYINETRFLVDKGVNTNVQDNLYDWVKYTQDNGVEINGVGFQGHFGETGLTSPEKLWEIFDRFAELGVKIKITELDIQTEDEELQAEYFRDFYTTVFAHPAAHAIISWGFWEKAHWRPSAAWYRKDWSIKPVGQMHKDLVYKEWWTNEAGSTDGSGKFQVRGFNGDYQVTVEADGKKVVESTSLSKAGKTLEVILK